MQKLNKIIHIIPTDKLGGTERNAIRMTEGWHARGLKSEIFIYKGTGKGYLVKEGYAKLINKEIFKVIKAESDKNEGIKIIVHFFGYHVLKLILINFFYIKNNIVVVQGNSFAKGRLGLKQLAVLLSLKLLGIKIIAVSEYVRQSVLIAPIFSKLMSVVYNGMDVDSFSCAVKAIRCSVNKKRNGGIVFGMLSRLDPIKDHETVLYAFKRYLEKYPERKSDSLIISGEGSLFPKLSQQVVELNLRDNVEIKGVYEDAELFFARIDVFIFSTSENEGFGNVLVEAACAEVPVLCSDIGPCREVLGQTGALYFKPKDVEHLCEIMQKVQCDRPRVADMKLIRTRFSISRMLDQYFT